MLLVTEYDPALEIESKLPPLLVRKVYLSEGVPPILNKTPTMFGEALHFVYLGYNLRVVESFTQSLTGNTENIILICPISKWGLYYVKLKTLKGIKISNQFDTRESKVSLVQSLTGLNKTKSTKALNLLQYNFAMIEKNLDLLRWCNSTGSDIESALASVENYSYTDVLFYLCGSKKHTQEKFIRTLSKYRHGKKHILKYLKSTLDEFIKLKLEGITPSKNAQYTVSKLSLFLYLEDAMRLRLYLDQVKELTDLLKGELR